MAAQPIESMDIGSGSDVEVPAWSGKLVEFIPRTVGLMMIHADDTRTHKPPPGWRFTKSEPVYVNDVELWTLRGDEDEDLVYTCLDELMDGEW